jgi:hypothetical protein
VIYFCRQNCADRSAEALLGSIAGAASAALLNGAVKAVCPATRLVPVVILGEAKNLSSVYVQRTERFFGEKHASE